MSGFHRFRPFSWQRIDHALPEQSVNHVFIGFNMPVSKKRPEASLPGPLQNRSDLVAKLGTSVVVLNSDLKIAQLNPAAQALLDASESIALGESIIDYFEQAEITELFRNCLKNTQATTVRQVELSDTSHQSKLVDCLVTPADVDASIYLILELNEVNQVAEQLLGNARQIGQSANTAVIQAIAHEIKNPLGGLRGAAQLLERKLAGEDNLTEFTRIIVKETDRLCSLVDDMSGLKHAPTLTDVNVHEALEHVQQLIRAEKGERVKLVRDYDPSLPLVHGDFEHLIQAFLNIVQNSIEASGDEVTIMFRSRVQRQATLGKFRYQSVARIEIEDDGPGIPSNMQDQVFLPLISGKPQGGGLGLAIVHQIIRLHGGDIYCESKPGRTRFVILLKFANCRAPKESVLSTLNGSAA